MMHLPLSDVVFFIEQYKYLLIIPIVIIEGPIITIICGFFIYLGKLNPYVVYVLLVSGDLAGDLLHYVIGKYWRNSSVVEKYGHFLGYNEQSEKFLENHFEKHKIKTIILAKFSYGIGTFLQIIAGIARVDFNQFFWISLYGTVAKTLILLFVGYYVGSSYVKINDYLNTTAFVLISVLIVVVSYIISNKLVKKYYIKNE
jgi:membrane-associated protein